jgi:hypothetical protein
MRRTVSEEPGDGFCSLRIQGLSGASAMVIEQTMVKRVGRSAGVYVDVSIAHGGASGRFDVAVLLDGAIEQVTFGNKNAVLWRRESSTCAPK